MQWGPNLIKSGCRSVNLLATNFRATIQLQGQLLHYSKLKILSEAVSEQYLPLLWVLNSISGSSSSVFTEPGGVCRRVCVWRQTVDRPRRWAWQKNFPGSRCQKATRQKREEDETAREAKVKVGEKWGFWEMINDELLQWVL